MVTSPGAWWTENERGMLNATVVLCVGSAYVAYYLLSVVKRPTLAGNPRLRSFLQKTCPIVRERFWPTWWCFESRMITLARVLLQSHPAANYKRDLLTLSDGGHVAIDWAENDASTHARDTRPTVLILPGLTGSSQESYVLHFVKQASSLGYRSVVFNYRGIGGAELKTARTYCACNTEDLREVVTYVTKQYPDAPIMAVGVSLGGMILTHFLTQCGSSCPLVAAMTFSSPWDVNESSLSLRRFINNLLFNRNLARNLTRNIKKNEHWFKNKFDLERVYQSRTIRDFDDAFTSAQFGYRDYREYYAAACLHDKVQDVQTPLLCLNSADDAFAPDHTIPMEDSDNSSSVAILKTSHGGHIGFLEGLFPRGTNYMDRVFAQFVDTAFKNTAELRAATSGSE